MAELTVLEYPRVETEVRGANALVPLPAGGPASRALSPHDDDAQTYRDFIIESSLDDKGWCLSRWADHANILMDVIVPRARRIDLLTSPEELSSFYQPHLLKNLTRQSESSVRVVFMDLAFYSQVRMDKGFETHVRSGRMELYEYIGQPLGLGDVALVHTDRGHHLRLCEAFANFAWIQFNQHTRKDADFVSFFTQIKAHSRPLTISS